MSRHDELLTLAVGVAHEAAGLIREARHEGVRVAATKTSITDVVTEVDRACELLIRERLLNARPGDGFLGEEGGSTISSSGVRWVVDPIDGTVNFVSGFPQYAVSIGAEIEDTVVAGVVVHVPSGTTYTATLGGGAQRDGERLHPAATGPPLAQALVATGFSYDRRIRALQARAVSRLLPEIGDIRRAGSCALDLCHVAEGSIFGYVEEGVNPWDHAAGGLIARECGARTELVTGAGGMTLLMCAPESGFAEFRDAIVTAGLIADTEPGDRAAGSGI
ncbi:MAG: inositol monophosphatase family protein [Nocardioides sp.]